MPTFTCRGCAALCEGRRLRIYCSLRCQREYEQTQLVALWLATGQANAGSGRRHYVRRHVLREQSGLCAICGSPPEWLGSPLAFVLDHIDGDSSNNVRANLRLVCSNCDSQLPTYKNRNRGAGRHYRRERYRDGRSY
ncbi:HNH endonuclease signature motif containing protein [Nocardioides nanhaiensis]|uniref:HNH endonuclease n=1 Tax=Nocardioides nanhaiensis TaxID=1476871 RepID=A0ABP8VXE2_9ACTN